MKLRTIALALLLGCGLSATMEAKHVKNPHVRKVKQRKVKKRKIRKA